MLLRIDVDPPAYDRLVDVAVAEHRPLAWQAEVLIRRALGLPDQPGIDRPPTADRAVEAEVQDAG